MQNVSEWMKKDVACVRPWDDLSRVAQLCWERDIGWLPVLDGEERLVGVVTDRDALLTMHFRGQGPSESRVEHAMSRELKSVMPQTSLPAALEVMARNGLRRLPVIDAQQKLVGVFTMADAARVAPKAGADDELVEAVREVLKPRAGDGAGPQVLQPKARVAPSKGDYAKVEPRMRTLLP
jgi:CBS-domain-containing membrane protein